MVAIEYRFWLNVRAHKELLKFNLHAWNDSSQQTACCDSLISYAVFFWAVISDEPGTLPLRSTRVAEISGKQPADARQNK
jgi:hypothetical protein